MRVLDLTRVLAGPTCARTLAEHGADVLKINGPHLPDSGLIELDTGIGKLAAHLDLRVPEGAGSDPHKPRLMPVSAIDYASGYLMAYGAMVALARRVREGGSWLVRVSLARTGKWIVDRRFIADFASAASDLEKEELERILAETNTGLGTIQHLKPVLGLSETPPYWERPPVLPGTHAAAWPARKN